MAQKIEISSVLPENGIFYFREFIYELHKKNRKHLLRSEIIISFEEFCDSHERGADIKTQSGLGDFFLKTQEMLLSDTYVTLLYRSDIARYKYYGFRNGDDWVDDLPPDLFLEQREQCAGMPFIPIEKKLLIDFKPFYSFGPIIRDNKKIGSGQRFLSGYVAGRLQSRTDKWDCYLYEFLKIHSINHEQILLDGDIINEHDMLFGALQKAIRYLEKLPPKSSIKTSSRFLKSLGFKEGFGNTVGRVRETMQLLGDVIEEPSLDNLDEFLSRIPMISKIAIISPHGWFGQENVLGRPDTGGQIVYILDQVRALEKHLTASLKSSGLSVIPKIIVLTRLIPKNEGTNSNQRLEKIHGTFNSWILRVPFRNKELDIIPQWIPRFQVWPYLEQFALDGKTELSAELGGKPDLIIGNYSDGNLVASLLSSWLHVIQCNIAHALEKSKYPFSSLYWKDMEKDYHFSLQYTADLISMNMTDIIISSTYQEIAGTETTMGQYESYNLFSMPGLYKVVNGINLFHPKFNVVSPGVDEAVYFPYTRQKDRLKNRIDELTHRLFEQSDETIWGHLDDPEKPPLFTLSRLDKIKNVSGLVESYGKNKELQKYANLVIAAGTVQAEKSTDQEEIEELKRIYHLIDEYRLQGKMRWLSKQTCNTDNGEIYRIIADRRGVFVQPAWYEAFGLTVLEAMASGLPVFATQFGGPLEIIQDGKSGFLINPRRPRLLTQPILQFFVKSAQQPGCWDAVSKQAIARVRDCYAWRLYSKKLLQFAKLYGFWNYSALAEEKKEIDQYCNLLFHLIYKNRTDYCLYP
ncbi:MAG: sucrose synthase [Nitrospinales bacterium]